MADQTPSPLFPEDLALLESLRQGGEWLRALLCTLARKGRAFRNSEPERTRALLDALSTYPWFKGGQFLFDLMEWEDFMLDGSSPPALPSALDAAALARLAGTLDQLKAHFDGASGASGLTVTGTASFLPVSEDLPELSSDMFLYEDTVLGVVLSVLPTFR